MARPATTTVSSASTKRKEAKAGGKETSGKAQLNGGDAGDEKAPDTDYQHFFWTYTEEPHRTRRMAIIKAHPEVRLCGYSNANPT